DPDVPILTAATGLLDEFALDFDRFFDGFAVSDLRLADIGFHAEFALHAIHNNLEMQFAHPRDDRLPGLLVSTHAERRVLLRKTVQRNAHLLLVCLGLRFDCLRNDRLRENHALEHDDLVRMTQGFAGRGFLQAYRGCNVTSTHFLDFFTLIGVHLQQTANTFLALAYRVVHGI